MVKKDGMIFRELSFWLKGDGGIRKNSFFNNKEGRVGFRKRIRKNNIIIEK